MRPAVFVAVGDGQAVGLGCCLKAFVVVGVPPAAILYPVFVIEIVYHFM